MSSPSTTTPSSSTPSSTTTPAPSHYDSPLSLGWILVIVFVCAILGQILVLGCYYLYKKSKNEGEHRDRVTTMHNAFMEAVENERNKKSSSSSSSANDRWGSYAGGSGLEVQRDAAEA